MLEVKAAPTGRFHLGGGLYLDRRKPGPLSGVWTFKFRLPGQSSREMGLGSLANVPLSDARAAAAAARRLVAAGLDPIAERDAARAAAALAAASRRSFRAAADAFLAERGEALGRNARHRHEWGSSLARYAHPVMGGKPVAEVTRHDVAAALRPIWTAKPETAKRTRQRIARVLDYAKAQGWRTGENPAELRGGLADLLGKRDAGVDHHPHLPPQRLSAFLAALAAHPGMSALALRFLILTAARTGEVVKARWGEVDWEGRAWNRPAAHMKGDEPHRVPLSAAALATVADAYRLATGQPLPDAPGAAAAQLRLVAALPVFPGRSRRQPLSNMAMAMLLRGMNETPHGELAPWRADDGRPVVVHGFRGSFRTWAGENEVPWDVAEAALAHRVGNAVAAAYHHTDHFERRRPVMERWAEWCLASSISALPPTAVVGI
jgi:integrase